MSNELETPVSEVPVKKKRKLFLWFFLVLQAGFILWVVTAAASSTNATCSNITVRACQDAQDTGKGIAVVLIVVIWVIVDFLLGVGYGIYRLAKRP